MEDLEKELNENCGCCPECDCGTECNCTPEDKCCDECTCDINCDCHNQECYCDNECGCGDKCDCDDKIESEDCENLEDNTCSSGEHCTCGDDCNGEDKCGEECDGDSLKDIECEPKTDDEKCQCGCGESVSEENTADAYFKQLLSLRAEFDNYRKRSQNDISKAYSNGFNQAITEFLPALDSFKMATEYIIDPNTLMGIQYIEKGILSTLEKMGIEVIDATGKFDPNLHQAIGSEVSVEHESGDIIKECFKGFKLGDKVIRYAQVIVAK